MARQSIHANDVQFTEESLKSFIKKIRNNIRDNLMFASTSDMAEKVRSAQELISHGILNNNTYQFNNLVVDYEQIDSDTISEDTLVYVNGEQIPSLDEEEIQTELYAISCYSPSQITNLFNTTQRQLYYTINNNTSNYYLVNTEKYYTSLSETEIEVDSLNGGDMYKNLSDVIFNVSGFYQGILENQSIHYKTYNNSQYTDCSADQTYNFNTIFLTREKSFTKAEEEIASHFPYNDVNNSWNIVYASQICIINTEIPYDSADLNNGRYTWVRGGSLLTFQEELSNIINETDRPTGTIWIDENNGTKTHAVLVKGFDNLGNFNNRNPKNYNENATEPFGSITTNNLYADTVQANTFLGGEGIFDSLSLRDHPEDTIGLYIKNTTDAYRISDVRTYDTWEKTSIPDDSFTEYNIISNISYKKPKKPEFTVTNIDGTLPFSFSRDLIQVESGTILDEQTNYFLEDGTEASQSNIEAWGTENEVALFEETNKQWQSGDGTSTKISSCKIEFSTDMPVQVQLIYQNDGYPNLNYSMISDLNKDLSTTASADPQWVALSLKSSFSDTERIYDFYIPAGESYIICKHIMPRSNLNRGYFKFKINFQPITDFFNIQYFTHPTSQPNQVEFHDIPFIVDPNNYFIKTADNNWRTCFSNELFYSNAEIFHKFPIKETFDYIGEEEEYSIPTYGDTEAWSENFNLDYPCWWDGPNGVYIRIAKKTPALEDEEPYLYAYYNSINQNIEYYKITDRQIPTGDDFSSIVQVDYIFTQIESLSTIEDDYDEPEDAIYFKQGYHYDFNVGNYVYSISGNSVQFIIDDTTITYLAGDQNLLSDSDGPYSLCPYQLNSINNLSIIDITGKKYFKLDYNLENLFTKNSNDEYIPLEYLVDYSNDLNNFYEQKTFDNSGEENDDPALGNDNPGYMEGSIVTDGGITAKKSIKAYRVHAAVFNDYAEYRQTDSQEPGRCVIEIGNGNMTLSSKRLQPGANIVSDTFGFSIGETIKAQTPIAVCGRVLAYPFEDKQFYEPGDAVCSGPNGTISKMTREEIREWPDRIVGYISEIPNYEFWGTDQVRVNGRVWIKIK